MKKITLLLIIFISLLQGEELSLSGSVISENQKFITSRYMGYVKGVYVNEGDLVKKGTILYEIDSIEIDNKKRQALLALQMYQNQHQLMKINLERHKRLFKKDMVSRYELENLELGEKNLQAMIDIGKAQLKEVENQYKYLKIRATNNGVVVSKKIKEGEMAIPGMPAITLTDLEELRIITEISETNLKKIKIGEKVEVSIPSQDLKTTGFVHSITPSSNPMTHTFSLKIKFDKQNKNIFPGMYATVVVKEK